MTARALVCLAALAALPGCGDEDGTTAATPTPSPTTSYADERAERQRAALRRCDPGPGDIRGRLPAGVRARPEKGNAELARRVPGYEVLTIADRGRRVARISAFPVARGQAQPFMDGTLEELEEQTGAPAEVDFVGLDDPARPQFSFTAQRALLPGAQVSLFFRRGCRIVEVRGRGPFARRLATKLVDRPFD